MSTKAPCSPSGEGSVKGYPSSVLTEDWAEHVRKTHGARIALRKWVNGANHGT